MLKMHPHPLLPALLLLVPTLCLEGCKGFWTSPDATPLIQAAVDVAVATAEQKGIAAAQINSIAKQALAADNGAGATVAALSNLLNAQLAKLKLPAGDLAAVDVLEVAFGAALASKLGANPTVTQVQAAAAIVLNDIITDTGG